VQKQDSEADAVRTDDNGIAKFHFSSKQAPLAATSQFF
jgi:hypothetical protein